MSARSDARGSTAEQGSPYDPRVSALTLIASGRDADVFDRGDGTVLRRYRRRVVPDREVEVMRYARASGYPVPAVIAASGPDLVLERVDGPTMQDALMRDADALARHARDLAELHHRLHAIAAPPWLPSRGDGDRLLHLDLHPKNVILAATGPVVIDWANAARGPAVLDPALAIAIFVTARAGLPELIPSIDAFIGAFAAEFDRDELRAAMPLAIELRLADANVSDGERHELASWPVKGLI
jgi:tRNA A-37 threonylcarbamoyl transferase component Bud32